MWLLCAYLVLGVVISEGLAFTSESDWGFLAVVVYEWSGVGIRKDLYNVLFGLLGKVI